MKNKLHYSFLLSLTLVGSLLALHQVPSFKIGNWKLRQVDLFSDIREDKDAKDTITFYTQASPPIDSLVIKQDSVVMDSVYQEAKPCPANITCIEDFSGDGSALEYFFKSLDKTAANHKKTRIAFYGDSFIEGDVFCGGFRDSLQSILGGEGVGFVPITSDVATFRNTIKHKFEGWETYNLIGKKDTSNNIGPSGYTFIPKKDNWLEYKPVKPKRLNKFPHLKFYYQSIDDHVIQIESDTSNIIDVLPMSEGIGEYNRKLQAESSVSVQIENPNDIKVFGASFESEGGMIVDNFSLRGNSGMSLSAIRPSVYKQFNTHRDYKLVILQFGLNVVVEDTLNYKGYTQRMIRVINQLKTYFPKTSFLLIGVSDRSTNTSGEFKTMNAIPYLRDAQKRIAEKTGIAFWDLYEAMGGENSMVKLSESKPKLAGTDYTHLNFRGGRVLSGRLVKALLHAWNNHKIKAESL